MRFDPVPSHGPAPFKVFMLFRVFMPFRVFKNPQHNPYFEGFLSWVHFYYLILKSVPALLHNAVMLGYQKHSHNHGNQDHGYGNSQNIIGIRFKI